jgi:hypothetical protein
MGLKSLFALLGTDLPQVEFELFALQDVTVSAATLSGAGRQARWNTSGIDVRIAVFEILGRMEKHKRNRR